MKIKIGVTGASGFIGKYLIQQLLHDNYNVSVLAHSDYTYPDSVEVIKGDLLSPKSVKDFLKNTDIIIHLAGRQLPPNSAFFQDNVVATTVLMDCLLESKVEQVIFLSTIAVYGDQKKIIHSESEECSPTTYYGLTKYLSEKSLQYWQATMQGKLTILRPFNVYGEHSTKGVVFNILKNIQEDKTIRIYGDGNQSRDFLHVSDVVNAIMLSIEKHYSGILNLGTGKKVTILDLAKLLKDILPYDVKIVFDKSEYGKTKDIEYSLSKVHNELGWNAKVSLEEGIKSLLK